MITVIGLGFVGLTTALGFAEKGLKVYGYDNNREKRDLLKNKQIPFHEPSLPEVLEKNINQNFMIVDDLRTAIENSEIIFFCVGTPSDEKGIADLSILNSAIENVLALTRGTAFSLLVIKSTVPPGTTAQIERKFKQPGSNNGNIYFANNPEFLREGHAWKDFVYPDRIVIGSNDEIVREKLNKVYGVFQSKIHFVTLNDAEFIKYLSNSLLATLISFSNEMSMIADAIGEIDIKKSFNILHEDTRWFGQPANMSTYVYPGCGYGGYCLPKDTMALYEKAKEFGVDAEILGNVIKTNDKIKDHVIKKITTDFSGKNIGILGLSFKPNSDDVRESAAFFIGGELIKRGYNIIAHDPMAIPVFQLNYKLPFSYVNEIKDLMVKSDRIVLLTAWSDYKNIKTDYPDKNILDFRYYLS